MKPFSRIISGTMTWGAWGSKFSIKQMQALIEKAVSLEISTFDHADIYGGYTTELEFGKAFKKSAVNREDVQFITKCGIQMPCNARPLPVKHYDYSAVHIRNSVEDSLLKLNTDYIDLLLLHRPSPLMESHIIAEEVQRLQKEGKVKQLGVSNFSSSQIQLLQQEVSLYWNQLECSLTYENAMFDGTLDFMKLTNIGAMAWSPLGNYFKESTIKQNRIQEVITPLCKKYNCSEDQLLLAWLIYHPSNIFPVVGTTSGSRLKKAVDSTAIKLEKIDWFLMLEASMGNPLP
ncbi:MAG: aldo/keto reductase [Flavobacteriaceae bacterium TMED179]|nr:MAG: aldo/keto reductase [Flavobacteriaceae bacterium TMED179]|tara:strand:+ start:12122 stop:12988 length:867 start_codon:yes stop_codon:yes gene_type:complete